MKRSRKVVSIATVAQMGARQTPLVFIVFSLILLTVSTLDPRFMGGARMQINDMMAPLIAVVSRPIQDVTAWIGEISGLRDLRAENERLKAENARLREWYQTALILKASNQSLRDLLNVRLDPRYEFVTAQILADHGNAYVKSLMLAAGARDGIRVGQAALSGEGLVGRVIETGHNTSRILLVNDFNSRIPVMIEGGKLRAVAAGTNDGLLALRHIPSGSELEAGARVLTSGDGGLFPPGLPVGRLERETSGTMVVRPYADLDILQYVRVIETADTGRIRAVRKAL